MGRHPLYTDHHSAYDRIPGYSCHAVNHSAGEYVRGDVHTNGIESAWSMLKGGYPHNSAPFNAPAVVYLPP